MCVCWHTCTYDLLLLVTAKNEKRKAYIATITELVVVVHNEGFLWPCTCRLLMQHFYTFASDVSRSCKNTVIMGKLLSEFIKSSLYMYSGKSLKSGRVPLLKCLVMFDVVF